MVTKTSLRFTIDVEGSPRTLISVGEQRGKGSLTLRLKAGDFFRESHLPIDVPGLTGRHGAMIRSQKYSIHPSKSSTEGNLLHHTIELKDKPNYETYHWTKAIKKNGNFTVLFARTHPDLSKTKYKSKVSDGVNVSIGSYDPNQFTLVTAVLIGGSERQFSPPIEFFNYIQKRFNAFSVIILWGFITAKSLDSACLQHAVTPRINIETSPADKEAIERHIEGYNDGECICFSLDMLQLLISELQSRAPWLQSTGDAWSLSGEHQAVPDVSCE